MEIEQLILPDGIYHRVATSSDQEAVTAFLQRRIAEFGLELDFDGTDRDLSDFPVNYDGGFFGILESETRIVGTFALFRLDDVTAEIRKMYLDPVLRGAGLGSQLLLMLESVARAHGFRRLELETFSKMTSALHLYQRRGYHEMPVSGCGDRCDRRFYKEI